MNLTGNYSKHRQQFQDKIVEKLLDGVKIHDTMNGRVCKTPTHPWIVFTAGVMVSYIVLFCLQQDVLKKSFTNIHILSLKHLITNEKHGTTNNRERGRVIQ